jgi:predicted CXXCH cytochrome family protein
MKMSIVSAAVLSAIVIIIGIIGCAEEVTGPGGTAGAHYVGAETCRLCHSTAYNDEMMTRHFNTMVDDPDNPYDFMSIWKEDGSPEYCLPCHTTGWDEDVNNKGADEPGRLKLLSGVKCEMCHGPGSEHVEGGGDVTKIETHFESELCGSCHNGEHHPTFNEWEESGHAFALEDLIDSGHASDHCLICHSADYYYDRTVTLDTAVSSIECVSCHDAHGSNEEHQLILPAEEMCSSCHNAEGAQVGSTPHHASIEMLLGYGGYEWAGEDYPSSPHKDLIEERCVRCHMYTEEYEDEENPAIAGHSFEPDLYVCLECHPGATDFNVNGAQTDIDNLLTQLDTELEVGDEEDEWYDEASFNYNFVVNDGGSRGVHNYKYAKALLEDAINYYEP